MSDYYFGRYSIGGKVELKKLRRAIEIFTEVTIDAFTHKSKHKLSTKDFVERLKDGQIYSLGGRRAYLNKDANSHVTLELEGENLLYGRHLGFEEYLAKHHIDADGGNSGYYEYGGEDVFVRDGEVYVIDKDRMDNYVVQEKHLVLLFKTLEDGNCKDALELLNNLFPDVNKISALKSLQIEGFENDPFFKKDKK